MTESASGKSTERLQGVVALPELHGERRFRASIRRGKGRQANLGVYTNRWLAAFAYNVAAEALHPGRRAPNVIPREEQPGADLVWTITGRVRRRLGLDDLRDVPHERPPSVERLRTFFEITVVGFWSAQAAGQGADLGRELDVAASRVVEAAHLLFWSRGAGHPAPLEVMEPLLALRLDRTFRRGDLTRAVLDDDGDDELRVARWLVYPDALAGAGGFRDAVERLYAERLGITPQAENSGLPGWAAVLGIAPPFSAERVRAAYRARTKSVHPDIGGSQAEFIRLQTAYEEAQRYCIARGL